MGLPKVCGNLIITAQPVKLKRRSWAVPVSLEIIES